MKRVFKTKRKVGKVKAAYRGWKLWEEGDWLIGTYKGSQQDQYDKPNYLIEIIECGFKNKKARTEAIAAKVIGLNSSGKLDTAMKEVEVGEVVQIVYNGTSTITKGKYKGKDAHDIEVDIVEEEGAEEEMEDQDEEMEEDTDEEDL